jgi:hypothetical protein
VSAPVCHGEEGEETNRRSEVAPTTDAQLAAEIENLRDWLAAALARNNEFERQAEDERMKTRGWQQRNCRIRI